MRWFCCALLLWTVGASASWFGKNLCKNDAAHYVCIKVGKNPLWKQIKASPAIREVVSRINRVNIGLSGIIAIPKKLTTDPMDVSPLPSQMPANTHNTVVVDLDRLAWGAYDANGSLQKWGPIAPGKDYCPDERSACRTKPGTFNVYRMGGAGCKSKKYPKPNGGAPMPFCMFFNGGIALHEGKLPGRPDSHGCVRVNREDARWLNEEFVRIGTEVRVRSSSL